MWAAEPPDARVEITARTHDQVMLCGRNAWCSGAAHVDHAVMTVWDEQGHQQLVTLAMNQPGVRVTEDGWQAVGMSAADSVEIALEQAVAQCIGDTSIYVERPGFWQGEPASPRAGMARARRLAASSTFTYGTMHIVWSIWPPSIWPWRRRKTPCNPAPTGWIGTYVRMPNIMPDKLVRWWSQP